MVAEKAAYYREKYNSRIQLVENTEFAVSSEDIRERVKDGRTIRYLVPKGVWDYIYDNELYK
jgi:nicotinate-nucleotide adenylyltransferase